MLWALKVLVVGDLCLDWNLELASRRVVDLCGVTRYVTCGLFTNWLALVFVALFRCPIGSDLFMSLGALNP
jgi:hypothetical protein